MTNKDIEDLFWPVACRSAGTVERAHEKLADFADVARQLALQAFKEAAQEMCLDCYSGLTPERGTNGCWYHPDKALAGVKDAPPVRCNASPIHALADSLTDEAEKV